MKERNFQTFFSDWIKRNVPQFTTVFELKLAKGGSLPFKSVKEHQVDALVSATSFGVYHKIHDLPVFAGSKTHWANKKPFDCFYIKTPESYVVIWFYHSREKKEMIWIRIEDWLKEARESDRKSLTEERARQIGIIYSF